MKTKFVVIVAVIAFLVGDYTACLRGKKKTKSVVVKKNRLIARYEHENDSLRGRLDAFHFFARKVNHGVDPREAGEQLENDLNFIDLIQPI